MAASEGQQWYIEEIPAIEQGDESGEEAYGHPPMSVRSGVDDTAPKAFITLDTGVAATLDTPQSKVEAMEGSVSSRDSRSSSGTTACAQQLGGKGEGAVGGTWSCKTFSANSSTQPPSPRGGCSWTKVGSRLLLFGGADAHQQHFADIHSFDENSGKWKKITVHGTPPSPRSGHSAVALGESLVVYGGMNGQDGVTFNDLFELRPGSAGCLEWVSLTCANAPPRNSHAAVLSGETMIIVGGASPEGQTDEVFTIDLADRLDLTCRKISCHPLEPSTGEANNPDVVGAVPTPREMHSACAFDSRGTEGTRATILIMGGRSADGVLRDLFSLDIDSWAWKRLEDAPFTRCAHSACFMETAGVMAVFGGWDGGTTVANDLHLFSILSGEWTTPSISPQPVGRFAHAACAGTKGRSVFVFGGVNPGDDLDDVLELSTAEMRCHSREDGDQGTS